ncbi:MAG: integrin [Planctomycetes bacterium]|nr:integrin [Planctomycetota bacterium]
MFDARGALSRPRAAISMARVVRPRRQWRRLLGVSTYACALFAMVPHLPDDRPAQQLAYLKSSNTQAGGLFGWSVAVSGDTLVVGAPGEDGYGAAYVLVRSGTTWVQQTCLEAWNPHNADWFGASVAISGDTIVVGAWQENSNATGVDGNQTGFASASGAAYVFVRSGTSWSQQAYLKASNTGAGDHFGTSVSISGDTLVVGANREGSSSTGVNGAEGDDSAPSSGAAYVFERSGSAWSQAAYLKASNTEASDGFGSSVAVSGSTVIVGASFESSGADGVGGDQSDNSAQDAGAAYVFVRDGAGWSQQAYLKASNSGGGGAFGGDEFGTSVSISGDTAVVGARWEDSAATGVDGPDNNFAQRAGAAYVFERAGTTWSQQAYLKASNTEAFENFGESVSISGDTVVVGASWEDSSASGIDGDQIDNGSPESGAAYVFTRTGATWSQSAYLKASNTDASDLFGSSVAVSASALVVGAHDEASSSTGVDGDESDDSAADAGAAYVFALGPGIPGSGCPGEAAPTCDSVPSASLGFSISCPTLTQTCDTVPIVLFGACATTQFDVPPPLGCGYCDFLVDQSWGSSPGGFVVGTGITAGFVLCVQ